MKLRVLIVEDDADQAEVTQHLLSTLSAEQMAAARVTGVEVAQADCVVAARQALEQAAAQSRPFDLMLLDLSLPETPGFNEASCHGLAIFELAQQLDVVRGVIIISAFTDLDHYRPAFKLGAVDFIEKPYKPEEMLTRVLKAWNLIRDRQRRLMLSRRDLAPYTDNGISYQLSSCFSKFIQAVRQETDALRGALLEQFKLDDPADLPSALAAPLAACAAAMQTAKDEWQEIQQPLRLGHDRKHNLHVEQAIRQLAEELRPCVTIRLVASPEAETRILSFQDAWRDNALLVIREIMVGGLADAPSGDEARLWEVEVEITRLEGMAEINFKDNYAPLTASDATTIQNGGAVAPRDGQWRAWGLSVVQHIALRGGGKLLIAPRESGNLITYRVMLAADV